MPINTHIFPGDKLEPFYNEGNHDALTLPFKIPNSTVIPKGTIVGEITASLGTVKAYASGNVDGSERPIGAMEYDVASDAAGNITIGGQAASEFGEVHKTCPVYVKGNFRVEDLIGLDSTGMTNGKFRILHGSLAAGVIRIP